MPETSEAAQETEQALETAAELIEANAAQEVIAEQLEAARAELIAEAEAISQTLAPSPKEQLLLDQLLTMETRLNQLEAAASLQQAAQEIAAAPIEEAAPQPVQSEDAPPSNQAEAVKRRLKGQWSWL